MARPGASLEGVTESIYQWNQLQWERKKKESRNDASNFMLETRRLEVHFMRWEKKGTLRI